MKTNLDKLETNTSNVRRTKHIAEIRISEKIQIATASRKWIRANFTKKWTKRNREPSVSKWTKIKWNKRTVNNSARVQTEQEDRVKDAEKWSADLNKRMENFDFPK